MIWRLFRKANVRAEYQRIVAEREELVARAAKAWPRSEREALLVRVRILTNQLLRIHAQMK